MFGLDLGVFMNAEMSAGSASAAGLTIMDGRNFVFDTVTVISDEAVAMQEDMPGFVEQNPTSVDFAANIPASSGQLVIIDNGFGPDALALFEAFNAVGPFLDVLIDEGVNVGTQFGLVPGEAQMASEMIDLGTINLGGWIQNQVTQIYAGFTGLNLEHDILEWMTGDYALYFALIPVESDLGFSFDVVMITENTDDEATSYIIERLAEASDLYDAPYTMEEIGDGEALVVDGLDDPPLFGGQRGGPGHEQLGGGARQLVPCGPGGSFTGPGIK